MWDLIVNEAWVHGVAMALAACGGIAAARRVGLKTYGDAWTWAMNMGLFGACVSLIADHLKYSWQFSLGLALGSGLGGLKLLETALKYYDRSFAFIRNVLIGALARVKQNDNDEDNPTEDE